MIQLALFALILRVADLRRCDLKQSQDGEEMGQGLLNNSLSKLIRFGLKKFFSSMASIEQRTLKSLQEI